MPMIWIGKVEAPENVLPNVNFNIKWRTWFIKWPWTKFILLTKIEEDKEYHVIDTRFFFGVVSRYKVINGIINNTKYLISSGYKD